MIHTQRILTSLMPVLLSSTSVCCGGGTESDSSTSVGGGSTGGSGGAPATTTQIVCAGMTADCDGDSSNGCEADLATDPMNCGECLKSCAGGSCNQGSCGPVLLASADGAYDCVDDGSTVFWVTPAGDVWKGTISGSSTHLATQYGGSFPSIAIDDTTVYWSVVVSGVGQGVGSVPRTGGDVTHLGIQLDELPTAIAVDDTHVFWSTLRLGDDGLGSIFKVAKTGSASATELHKASPPAFHDYSAAIVDDSHVFWWSSGAGGSQQLLKVAKTGGSAGVLVNQTPSPSHCLRADDTTLFWVDGHSILWRLPKTGGNPQKIAALLGTCNELAVDNDYLYIAQDTGQLARVDKLNGDLHVLAQEEGSVQCVTARGPYVYWSVQPSSSGGSIKMLVK